MGFFSNLKNKITGGSATVNIQVPSVVRGQPASVRIEVTAKADGKVNGVYLLINAVETCEVKDTDWNGTKHTTEIVRGRKTSYENKLTVAGGFDMKAGQVYNFDARVELPTNTNPSFDGKMIEHEWAIQAGLDMAGNDPDSGWIKFEVR
jgi:hypothetical protein